MSVLLYVGIINILCMYHIKYYVMFSYIHCVCDMLFFTYVALCYVVYIMLGYICNIMLHLYVMPFGPFQNTITKTLSASS